MAWVVNARFPSTKTIARRTKGLLRKQVLIPAKGFEAALGFGAGAGSFVEKTVTRMARAATRP